MYFYIFTHCKIVKGAMQSMLYDLDRNKYYIVPHSFSDFVGQYNGFSIEKLYEIFDQEEHETLSEYIQFLREKQLAFFCPYPNDSFLTDVQFEYRSPYRIHNALIGYDPSFDFKHLVSLLDKEGCRHVFIYSFKSISVNDLIGILSSFDNSGIISVQILMKYTLSPLIFIYKYLVKKYARFLKLVLHHAPYNKGFLKYGQFEYHIGYLKKKINGIHSLYDLYPYNFDVNIQLFTEAQYYNTFFNKKLIIDSSGNIKPDLFSSEIYANIFSLDSLKNVLSDNSLKKYWHVRKDDILICKDCEYRYMCVDCRTPTFKDGKWHLPSCSYDPYTAKFEDKAGSW